MKYFADIHNHSKYSRATSKEMDLHQSFLCKEKLDQKKPEVTFV